MMEEIDPRTPPVIPAWIERKVFSFDRMNIHGIRRSTNEYFFNPTLLSNDFGFTLLCRYIAEGRREIIALNTDRDFMLPFLMAGNFSKRIRELNSTVHWHADPRYFKFSGRHYVTFNTGHSERPNNIYVVEIDGTGDPTSIFFTVDKQDGRTPIEKNWGFFEYEGSLYCTYSVSPLIILKCKFNGNRLNCKVAYEHHWHSGTYELVHGAVHGGPPPLRIKDRYYLVVQSKYPADTDREYFSSLLCLEGTPPFRPIEFSNTPLFCLTPEEVNLQPRHKLNTKLKSCLYPSGFVWEEELETVVLSYGINDYRCGIRRYKIDTLRSFLSPVLSVERKHPVSTGTKIRTFYWKAPRTPQPSSLRSRVKTILKRITRLPAPTPIFKHGNIGDEFQELLVSKIWSAAPILDIEHGGRLLGMGSIAHMALANDVICGSGSKDIPIRINSAEKETVDVKAVRGPLTLAYLKKSGIDVRNVARFFDAGSLVDAIFRTELDQLRKAAISHNDILFIPHFRDNALFQKEYGTKGHRILKVDSTLLNFCAEIMSAKLVVSSSLHGIVFAEALGIPALMHQPSSIEKLEKYQDYYYGTDRFEYPIIDTLAEINLIEPPQLPKLDKQACLAIFPGELDLRTKKILSDS